MMTEQDAALTRFFDRYHLRPALAAVRETAIATFGADFTTALRFVDLPGEADDRVVFTFGVYGSSDSDVEGLRVTFLAAIASRVMPAARERIGFAIHRRGLGAQEARDGR